MVSEIQLVVQPSEFYIDINIFTDIRHLESGDFIHEREL